MARDSSVPDDDSSAGSDVQPADESGNTGLLGRRSYLKLAGATTAATAFSTAASATRDDYEVIEARGQTITVGSGETFENKLIDMSTGDTITIVAQGSDWTIRNVGFDGADRSGRGNAIFGVQSSGNAVIENLYLGDGAAPGNAGASSGHGTSGIWVNPNHSGHIEIRNANIQGMRDNGIYASAPGSNGNGNRGTVAIRDSVAANNYVSNFRTAGGVIENCVAWNDGDGPNGRPLWVWPTRGGLDVDVIDSHFEEGGYPGAVYARSGGPMNLTLRDSEYSSLQGATGSIQTVDSGRNPQQFVPDGVPTSAAEAAAGEAGASSGGSADADDEDLPHLILFDGDAADVTRYEFTVDGDIETSNAEGATIDDAAEIDDGTAHGVVADWKDAFRFDGDLEELTVDGPATVYVDGDEIDPDDVGAELPHALEVAGQGEPTSFELTVDGEIELEGDEEDETTAISGSTVQSSVSDETLTFRFAGALTDVTIIDGEAAVSLDGDEIDPDEYGDHELLPHALVIDGTEADEPSSYSFEASGAVVKSTYQEATISGDDVVEGRAVRGVVDDWLDAYWFDGDITDFRLNGDAGVDVQYNVRDQ